MRSLTFLTIMIVALTALSCNKAHSQDPESVKNELLQLERRLIVAIQRKDTDSLNMIWDDEYMATTADGRVITKKDLMAAVDGGVVEVTSIEPEDLFVRVFDNVAVMTGKASALGRVADKDVSMDLRGTGIFVKRPSGWKIAGVHLSPNTYDPASNNGR